MKTSLLDKEVTFLYNASKLQVQKEYSLSPPNLVFSNTVFNDKSIQWDRPVYSPVLIASAPVEFRFLAWRYSHAM
jgi:hypothetical protein